VKLFGEPLSDLHNWACSDALVRVDADGAVHALVVELKDLNPHVELFAVRGPPL
jgi:hypothetical protein